VLIFPIFITIGVEIATYGTSPVQINHIFSQKFLECPLPEEVLSYQLPCCQLPGAICYRVTGSNQKMALCYLHHSVKKFLGPNTVKVLTSILNQTSPFGLIFCVIADGALILLFSGYLKLAKISSGPTDYDDELD
jgi:hypothetical protein